MGLMFTMWVLTWCFMSDFGDQELRFGFEDWNAVILQAVHGTEAVTRQILCHVSAQLQLKSFFFFVTMPKCERTIIYLC